MRKYITVKPKLNKLNRWNSIIIGNDAFDVYKTNTNVYLTEIGHPERIVAKFEAVFFEYLEYCRETHCKLYGSTNDYKAYLNDDPSTVTDVIL